MRRTTEQPSSLIQLKKLINLIAPRNKKGKRKLKWWALMQNISSLLITLDNLINTLEYEQGESNVDFKNIA